MTETSAIRKRKLRSLEVSNFVEENESDDFLILCESDFSFHEDWGGLSHEHYASFLSQYCQKSPGEACQKQANFWNLDLRFQKIFMSAGCPGDAEQNEKCIEYFLQNNPQHLRYAGDVIKLCELTEDLLIPTGLMQVVRGDGDVESKGKHSGNPPLDIQIQMSESPSLSPTSNWPDLPSFDTYRRREKDEKDQANLHVISFLVALVISGMCLGMASVNIRKLRSRKRKVPVAEIKKKVHDEESTQMPRSLPSALEDESSFFSICNSLVRPARKKLLKPGTTLPSMDEQPNPTNETLIKAGVSIEKYTQREEYSVYASLRRKLSNPSAQQHCQQSELKNNYRVSDSESKAYSADKVDLSLATEIGATNEESLQERGELINSTKKQSSSIGSERGTSTIVTDYSALGGFVEQVQDGANTSTALSKIEDTRMIKSPRELAVEIDPSKQDDISSTQSVSTDEESLRVTIRRNAARAAKSFHNLSRTGADPPEEVEVKAGMDARCSVDPQNKMSQLSGFDDIPTSTILHNSVDRYSAKPQLQRQHFLILDVKSTDATSNSSQLSIERFPANSQPGLSQLSDFDDISSTGALSDISDSSQLPIEQCSANCQQLFYLDGMSTGALSNSSNSSHLPIEQCSACSQQLSDFDDMSSGSLSVCDRSDSSQLSIEQCSVNSQTKLTGFDHQSTGALSDSSDRSRLSIKQCSANPQTKLYYFNDQPTGVLSDSSDRSWLSIEHGSANNQTELSQLSGFDGMSTSAISASSDSSRLSIGQCSANFQKELSQLFEFDDISTGSISHSSEWSMDGNIRQTFNVFEQKLTDAIAELNDDMHTVDTTSTLRGSECDCSVAEGNAVVINYPIDP